MPATIENGDALQNKWYISTRFAINSNLDDYISASELPYVFTAVYSVDDDQVFQEKTTDNIPRTICYRKVP